MPTIFYSWQSDRPNSTNRNFIRRALADAVEALNNAQGVDVEDAVRLDQDTQNVPGSPAIVDTILNKIDACDVFVPDVTFVAENDGRLVSNPNVMIEYGYALKSIGAAKLMAVMNTFYGPQTGIPFDMRHRRFPIAFELAPDADNETRRAVRERLVIDLRRAMASILAANPQPVQAQPEPFDRAPSFDRGATFVDSNELFDMWLDGEGDVQRRFPEGPKMFLRLMPRDAVDQIDRAALLEALAGSDLWPLGHQRFSSWGKAKNRYGACYIARHPADNSSIGAISQVLLSREIWGVESHLLTHAESQRWVDREFPVIPDQLVRQIFTDALSVYLATAQERLHLHAPFIAIAGLANLEGHRLTLSNREISTQIYESVIAREILIEDPDLPAERLLHPFYAAIFDAAGVRLPPP